MMSEEIFNEIVDGFEYIRTLTEWDSKNIKQHIQRLQQENERQKEIIDKANKKLNNMFDNGDDNKILDDLLELSKILEGVNNGRKII